MSGFSGDGPCPNCGKNMNTYTDYKPFNNASGECIECGFYYKTVSGQMSLKELNSFRSEHNNDPLSKHPEINHSIIWPF